MKQGDLQLEHWDNLLEGERLSLSRQLADQLPMAFQLIDVASYAMGDQWHWVARFDYQGATFVLIPGGTVTLGYDPDQTFNLTPSQRESWNATVAEYGPDCSFDEYLLHITTPLRTVALEPFLLEVDASEVGLEAMDLNDLTTAIGPELRFEFTDKESITAYSVTWKSQQQVAEETAAEGFRLPTSDEWEYACSAGSRSLFRWGNNCPERCYPTDPRCADFDYLKPNAFGLQIAQDPYKWEFVAESEFLRGGDGGSTICGGAGFLVGWLTLASAYIDKSSSHWQGQEVPLAHVRRALSLE